MIAVHSILIGKGDKYIKTYRQTLEKQIKDHEQKTCEWLKDNNMDNDLDILRQAHQMNVLTYVGNRLEILTDMFSATSVNINSCEIANKLCTMAELGLNFKIGAGVDY